MFPDDTRSKIENIVGGVVIEGQTDHCTAIRNFLCARFATSTDVKEDFEGKALIKKEQAVLIEGYCDEHGLWVENMPWEEQYL